MFYIGVRDPNTGSHVCVASTLSSEPATRLLKIKLLKRIDSRWIQTEAIWLKSLPYPFGGLFP